MKLDSHHYSMNKKINMFRDNIPIFNQIRYIQEKKNTLVSIIIKPITPDHISDIFNIPLMYQWYDSKFASYDKISISTTPSAPFSK